MKRIFLFILFVAPFLLQAQFDENPHKYYLNWQTDSKGLINYGAGAPSYTPSTRWDAYAYFDTIANVNYQYHFGVGWQSTGKNIYNTIDTAQLSGSPFVLKENNFTYEFGLNSWFGDGLFLGDRIGNNYYDFGLTEGVEARFGSIDWAMNGITNQINWGIDSGGFATSFNADATKLDLLTSNNGQSSRLRILNNEVQLITDPASKGITYPEQNEIDFTNGTLVTRQFVKDSLVNQSIDTSIYSTKWYVDSQADLFFGDVIFVAAAYGDDATGKKGSRLNAFKTVHKAIDSAQVWNVKNIIVSAGLYNLVGDTINNISLNIQCESGVQLSNFKFVDPVNLNVKTNITDFDKITLQYENANSGGYTVILKGDEIRGNVTAFVTGDVDFFVTVNKLETFGDVVYISDTTDTNSITASIKTDLLIMHVAFFAAGWGSSTKAAKNINVFFDAKITESHPSYSGAALWFAIDHGYPYDNVTIDANMGHFSEFGSWENPFTWGTLDKLKDAKDITFRYHLKSYTGNDRILYGIKFTGIGAENSKLIFECDDCHYTGTANFFFKNNTASNATIQFIGNYTSDTTPLAAGTLAMPLSFSGNFTTLGAGDSVFDFSSVSGTGVAKFYNATLINDAVAVPISAPASNIKVKNSFANSTAWDADITQLIEAFTQSTDVD